MVKISILELIYPKTCGVCEEISKTYLCSKCRFKIKNLLKLNTITYKDKYFNSHTYLFKYEGEIRDKLLKYKFRDYSYLYKFFSEIIINNCNLKNNYDIILPVPIHKKRKQTRGYNQSELIAKEVAKNVNVEYSKKVLIKAIDTVPQSTLNQHQREKSVLGIYKVINSQIIKDKNILLIDDIYTTGSTLNECSKVLKQNGAKSVDVLTIAKD